MLMAKRSPMSIYKGLVVLVVNVASNCGFTHGHYQQLKDLEGQYSSLGLRVAAFPCNQFGAQEPACEAEIRSFVKDSFDYSPDLYAKVDVNGDSASPLWTFLKQQQGGTLIDAIKWNFTKFLVDRQGRVVSRHAPTTSPADLEDEIQRLLQQRNEL